MLIFIYNNDHKVHTSYNRRCHLEKQKKIILTKTKKTICMYIYIHDVGHLKIVHMYTIHILLNFSITTFFFC